MLTRTHLIVDVSELLDNPGTKERLSFTTAVEGLALELVRVDDPVGFDLAFSSLEDEVLVDGTLEGRYVTTCRRCLSEDVRGFRYRAAEVYSLPPDAPEPRYVVTDGAVDLDPLVRDNVLLELPQNPLCREDCQGLCPDCGADLNEGGCSCPSRVADLRWSPLQDLLRDG